MPLTEDLSKTTFVCLRCRVTAKRTWGTPRCPKCANDMHSVGKHYRVPKQRDDKGWKAVAAYVAQLRRWRHPARWFKEKQMKAGIAANTHGTIGRKGRKPRKYNRADNARLVRAARQGADI